MKKSSEFPYLITLVLGAIIAIGIALWVGSAQEEEQSLVAEVADDVRPTRPVQLALDAYPPEPTTTVKPHVHRPKPRTTTTRASRSAPGPRPTGDIWAALARCESGGNPRAVSSSGRYRGAFQFSLATWQSIGYSGDPIDHPYAVQLQAAQKLQAQSGWGQWPSCARQLGLI